MDLTFDVNGETQSITRTDSNVPIDGSIGCVIAIFVVSSDMKDLVCTPIFNFGPRNYKPDYSRTNNEDGTSTIECVVPHEVLHFSSFSASLFGTDALKTKRINFPWCDVQTKKGSNDEGGVSSDPSLTVYEKVLRDIADLQSKIIDPTKLSEAITAYFVAHPISILTKTDVDPWIEQYVTANKSTLKGDPGDPGSDGLSVYQIAVLNGYIGTETQWLASLKGSSGDPGKSAYQIAVDNGYLGTETEWLVTLKGNPGDPGSSGLSAYQIAVLNGYIGTEVQWLESLKGAKGDPGADLVNNGLVVESTENFSYTLLPNQTVIFNGPVTALNLSLPATYNPWDEFKFTFTTSTSGGNLALPSGITWLCATPTLVASKYYECSIENSYAVIYGKA